MSADERVKRQVWVQCGGRCVICNELLLEDHLDDPKAIRGIGEVAHIAAEADGGARADLKMTAAERNDASNLMLLCPNDHTSADKRLKDSRYTAGYLHDVKRKHEAFVRHATSLRDEARTTIVRIHGDVRGNPGVASRSQAAEATMNCAKRVPQYMSDPLGQGVEVSVLDIPETATPSYWDGAARKIAFDLRRVRQEIADGHIEHVSVFAFAYVPLLVLAGSCLDNTYQVDVYERHRHSNSWLWDDSAAPFKFQCVMPSLDGDSPREAVLIVNASGTVSGAAVPAELTDLPRFMIELADGVTPGPATFNHRKTLANFVACLTSTLPLLEPDRYRSIRRMHVLAAVPVSAAVELGRQWPVGNAAPIMALYHLDNDAYHHVLDVPWNPSPPPLTATRGDRCP